MTTSKYIICIHFGQSGLEFWSMNKVDNCSELIQDATIYNDFSAANNAIFDEVLPYADLKNWGISATVKTIN